MNPGKHFSDNQVFRKSGVGQLDVIKVDTKVRLEKLFGLKSVLPMFMPMSALFIAECGILPENVIINRRGNDSHAKAVESIIDWFTSVSHLSPIGYNTGKKEIGL